MKLDARMRADGRKRRCVGSGLVALDLVMNGSDNVEPRTWAGGSCGNVLTILSYLGWDSYPAARVGKDPAANLILRDLRKFGVHTNLISKESNVCTPIILQRIRRDKMGQPKHTFSLTCPVCAQWYPMHRPVTIVTADRVIRRAPSCEAFYFDRVSPGVLRIARRAAELGALVVFEPSSIKADKNFEEALILCHVLKYSVDQLKGRISSVFKVNPILTIETLGSKGLRFKRGGLRSGRWKHLAPFQLDGLEDVAGAGDWCTAAIINELGGRSPKSVAGMPTGRIERILAIAQAVSAVNCRFEGARGAMYSLSSVQFKRDAERILKHRRPREAAETLRRAKSHQLLQKMCPSCRDK